jgi:hypothetical protein
MQGSAGTPSPVIGYVIMVVVLVVVLGLRMRSVGRERPLKLGQLWIVPAVYGALTAAFFVFTPPARAIDWAIALAALVIGGAVGWQRGRFIHISVDPERGEVRMKQSLMGVLFIVVIVALKVGMNGVARNGATGLFGMPPQTLTDIALAFMLGVFGVQRIEMYLRARRLLGEAQVR